MKHAFFALLAFCSLALASDPAPVAPAVTPEQALTQLRASGTVYQASLAAVEKYVAGRKMVLSATTISPLRSGDTSHFILGLVYLPADAKKRPVSPRIFANVYFVTPSHFDRTFGHPELRFYKFETTEDTVRTGAPQPSGTRGG